MQDKYDWVITAVYRIRN